MENLKEEKKSAKGPIINDVFYLGREGVCAVMYPKDNLDQREVDKNS